MCACVYACVHACDCTYTAVNVAIIRCAKGGGHLAAACTCEL